MNIKLIRKFIILILLFILILDLQFFTSAGRGDDQNEGIDTFQNSTVTTTEYDTIIETIFEFQVISSNWKNFLDFFFILQSIVVVSLILIKISFFVNSRYDII